MRCTSYAKSAKAYSAKKIAERIINRERNDLRSVFRIGDRYRDVPHGKSVEAKLMKDESYEFIGVFSRNFGSSHRLAEEIRGA